MPAGRGTAPARLRILSSRSSAKEQDVKSSQSQSPPVPARKDRIVAATEAAGCSGFVMLSLLEGVPCVRNGWKADIVRRGKFWLYGAMRYRVIAAAIGLGLSQSAPCMPAASINPRLCIEREGQNGSLNIAPTILTIRSRATGSILATKRFEDAGWLCVRARRGLYTLVVRFAEPWTGAAPPRWWTRTFVIDHRPGGARYVMTNPDTNDVFQAMIAGRDGWHRLWPVHRVR
jgi:hypothetical protein